MNSNTRSASLLMDAQPRQSAVPLEHANGDKAAAGNRETPPGGALICLSCGAHKHPGIDLPCGH